MKLSIIILCKFQHVNIGCINCGVNQFIITGMTNLLKSHVKNLHIVKLLSLIRVNVQNCLRLRHTQALSVSCMKRGRTRSVLSGLFAPKTVQ